MRGSACAALCYIYLFISRLLLCFSHILRQTVALSLSDQVIPASPCDLFSSDMQARSAAQQPLPGGAGGPPVQGVVQVDAYCGLPEGLPALTQLLADALKGLLPGCPRPLQVSHPA